MVAERGDERLERRPLLAQQVGPRAPLRLVFGVDSVRPEVPASQATTVGVRPWSVISFTSIEAKPKIAFVGSPVEVAIDSGSAKNAR